jgi:DNA-binding MarR family transcriptional regulator
VIYWKVVKGESLETPFSKIIAKAKYKKNTTVRNINTLEKMIEE